MCSSETWMQTQWDDYLQTHHLLKQGHCGKWLLSLGPHERKDIVVSPVWKFQKVWPHRVETYQNDRTISLSCDVWIILAIFSLEIHCQWTPYNGTVHQPFWRSKKHSLLWEYSNFASSQIVPCFNTDIYCCTISIETTTEFSLLQTEQRVITLLQMHRGCRIAFCTWRREGVKPRVNATLSSNDSPDYETTHLPLVIAAGALCEYFTDAHGTVACS